jgi:hypothetical protein
MEWVILLIVLMELVIQGDGLPIGSALHHASLRMTDKQ